MSSHFVFFERNYHILRYAAEGGLSDSSHMNFVVVVVVENDCQLFFLCQLGSGFIQCAHMYQARSKNVFHYIIFVFH